MTPTPEMIEAAAIAMANFDASLVGVPTLQSVTDFRFDKDRGEYTRRAESALKSAFGAMWRPIRDAPKTGTRILVWCGDFYSVAWWDSAHETDDGRRGIWTDGGVASWGYEEIREIHLVCFAHLTGFDGSTAGERLQCPATTSP
ncbi:hypothetical protein [Acetobacter estunensis]|uniref:hypothetical protein n=1 Tax=Acetobacter estunensis TaxID=104097 RepID=UPI001C2D6B02|nr:hypothetical protein [Acetobacter estunensis]MBV1835617.1 hypothetical protein [Acetobacter estunensis]MBV1836122.1 hypothetical protein [Acetobacter estunensis]